MGPDELEKIQKAARVVAMLIATELQSPYAMTKDTTLEASPPSGDNLRFQTHHHQAAPKDSIIAEMGDQHVGDRIFCTVDGIYVSTANMDVEHATPYATIVQRQKAFLDFLNKNPEFSDMFLKIKIGETDMRDFFKNDPNDSYEIKGTKYFYKCAYNAIDNLWLLSHGENTSKGKKDFMVWADGKELDIVEAVKRKGGEKRGIFIDVMPKVGRKPIAKINGQEIYAGMGLGKFIRQWIAEKYRQSFALHKEFYEAGFVVLQNRLDESRALDSAGKPQAAHDMLRDLTKNVHMGVTALSAPLQRHSDSETDSDDAEKVRDTLTDHYIEAADEETHLSKEIKRLIGGKYPDEAAEVCQNLSRIIINHIEVVKDFSLHGLYESINFPSISLEDIKAEISFFDKTYKAIAEAENKINGLELEKKTDRKKSNDEHSGSSSTAWPVNKSVEKLKKADREIERLYAEIERLKASQRQRAAKRRAAILQAQSGSPLPIPTPETHFSGRGGLAAASQKRPLPDDDKKSSDTATLGSNSKRRK